MVKVNNKISEQLNREIRDSEKLAIIPLDTERKFNMWKLFVGCLWHLLNVACTFHLRPVSRRIINWFNILSLKVSGKHLWWCLSIVRPHILYLICCYFENIFVCYDVNSVRTNFPFLFACFLVFWSNCYWVLESTEIKMDVWQNRYICFYWSKDIITLWSEQEIPMKCLRLTWLLW